MNAVTISLENMQLTFEFELEHDGRWIAEIPEIPGVIVYGQTKEAAREKATVLALRVIADRIEHREQTAEWLTIAFGG